MNKKEAKEAYKLQKKIGGIVAYENKDLNKIYIDLTQDLMGAKNRYAFSQKTGLGLPMAIIEDFKKYDFDFYILEELEQTESQSAQEFKEDLLVLKDLWLLKLADRDLY
jgi:hypothetical protein